MHVRPDVPKGPSSAAGRRCTFAHRRPVALGPACPPCQAGRAVETFGDALTCAATVQYLEERRLVTAALHREGILTIDAPAAELPVALGNLYLDIKKAGTL